MIQDDVLINDWHVVARSADVPYGELLAARLLYEDIVLWRANGEIFAWQDLCIHRGTRLSLGKVEEEMLVCPYHGWNYNKEGRCVKIPAHPNRTPPTKAKVKRYQAREKYGLIWMSLGEPVQDIPPFPEWDDVAYRKIPCGPYKVEAGGPRIIEISWTSLTFPLCMKAFWVIRAILRSKITRPRSVRRVCSPRECAFISLTLTVQEWETPWFTPIACTVH